MKFVKLIKITFFTKKFIRKIVYDKCNTDFNK